nr:ABC transporter substrate-binding protein [Bradyrhizobium sp. 1]
MTSVASIFRSIAMIGSVIAFLVVLANPLHAAEPRRGGSLVYAYLSGPGTLDPHVASSLVELEVIHHIFEPLVAIDGNYNARPVLASKIDTNADATVFTFTLRKGVKFHNGKEMNSADVLASFERYRKVSPNASVLADVEGFEAPDPLTFVIRLKKPNAVFVDVLKSPVYPFEILPAEQKDKAAREIDIIGTGPFMLGEWVKDSHLVIKRFDAYVPDDSAPGPDGLAGRRTAYLDQVRYNFVPEANARVAALQTGNADVIGDVPRDLAKRFEAQANIKTQQIFPYCMQVFVVNTQAALTNNPLIRQAIEAVVNVEDITGAMGQISRPGHSLVYASSPYYQGDAMKPYYDQRNPAKAKALLKQAGYNGEKIVLQTNSNYPNFRDAILVLSEQMKDAGMNVAVDIVDWTTNASNMQRGTGVWNVSTTGYCSNPLLGPQQWKVMIYTFPHVKDDQVLDTAYDKFYASLDPKQRIAAWADIEKRVLDQAYMIKIADMGTMRSFNAAKVANFEPYYIVHFWDVWLK